MEERISDIEDNIEGKATSIKKKVYKKYPGKKIQKIQYTMKISNT